MTIGLDVKRDDRIARGLGEPDGSRLRDLGRAARAIESEARRPTGRHVALQPDERLHRATRRRSARSPVAEALDDPRDPLPVEILTGDDDDAAPPEVDGGGENAAVPEGHNRLAAAVDDLLVVLDAFRTPAERRAERRDDGIAGGRDQRRLKALRTR